MNNKNEPIKTFFVKDCVLAPIATGVKVQSLIEFRDQIKTIPIESIYYHFWRQAINSCMIQGAFFNDFSNWAHYHLHDDYLAECLALIDPSDYEDLEVMRFDMLNVIENRIDERSGTAWFFADEPLHFVKSNIIVFDSNHVMQHPKELVKILPTISSSSIFYHFVDARRRESNKLDDFSKWINSFDENFQVLLDRFKNIDPYFIKMAQLQDILSMEVTEYFINNKNNQ